jgi:hypothetical protein
VPNRDEKAKRKEILHTLREEQSQKVRESLPAEVEDLKKLFDFVDKKLSDRDCDDTLRFTLEFVRQNAMDESRVVPWLESNGGYCDCEVLNNVEEVVDNVIPKSN